MKTFLESLSPPYQNHKVRTTTELICFVTCLSAVSPQHMVNRKANEDGWVVCAVQGSKKALYYVLHTDYSYAVYYLSELIPNHDPKPNQAFNTKKVK